MTEGGEISFDNVQLTMGELLAGLVEFKVKNSQGNIVSAYVVQYPSDQNYYIQADGALLWQVQPIQHTSNTIVITPSQSVTSGFELVGVEYVQNPVIQVSTTPALPWDPEQNGTLNFNYGVTFNDIAQHLKLDAVVGSGASIESLAADVMVDQGISFNYDGNVVYWLPIFAGYLKTITLEFSGEPAEHLTSATWE